MGSTQSSPRGPSEVRRHKLECAKQKLQEAMITIRQAGDGWPIDHRILTIQESIAQLKRKTGWPIEGQVPHEFRIQRHHYPGIDQLQRLDGSTTNYSYKTIS